MSNIFFKYITGHLFYSFPVHENALGRLALISNAAQTKRFSYDRMGRVKHETRTIRDTGTGNVIDIYDTGFTYDLRNRKRMIRYPEDPATGTSLAARYSYGSMGVSRVDIYTASGRKSIVSDIRYNELGQIRSITRGNGTETFYDYDIKGRLRNLVTNTETNAQVRKLQDVNYIFKIDDSIRTIVDTPDMNTQGGFSSTIRYDYEYDGLNRLVKAAGSYSRSEFPNSG